MVNAREGWPVGIMVLGLATFSLSMYRWMVLSNHHAKHIPSTWADSFRALITLQHQRARASLHQAVLAALGC